MIPLIKNTFFNEPETKKALVEFIKRTDRLSMNKKCAEFEERFAKWQDRRYAVLFNSGGSANLALLQALKNLGFLKNGDKIAFSALTWSTNVMPIIQMGLEPIAVDCDPTTLNVMSHNLEDRIKSYDIKAFFITNALGFTGNLDIIQKICKEKEILLLEDNCESLGTELFSGKAGNFGMASTFSFFVGHHMSTIEGGMICSDNAKLVEMLCIVRANGWDRNLSPVQQSKLRQKFNINNVFQAKYAFYDLGFNLRPTEITGFLGLHQLQSLDRIIKIRQKNYLRFSKSVLYNPDLLAINHKHISTISAFCLPIVCRSSKMRGKYIAKFGQLGAEVRPIIAGNIQRQPFYKKYVKKRFDLSGTEFLHNNGFYCGNYPELTETELKAICNCI